MAIESKIKALVVDDDSGMRKSLVRIMKARGYDVSSAASGEEAVEVADAEDPDCVLMDIKMPGMNGVEAFARIRERHPETFVVFMTAYASSSLVDKARLEGAVDVVSKPFDVDSLCSVLTDSAKTRPILVVDDDKGFAESLQRVLAAKAYEVELAFGAQEALALYEKCPRSIVLLDMRLADGSGIEVLKALKALNPSARVILMSGFPELAGAMDLGLTMSATACFSKPVNIGGLLISIEDAVERSKARGAK